MALTLIKEDGTGKADANSYASVADAEAYHEGHLYATAWTGATAEQKAAALVMATRLIDAQFQFNGVRTNEGQALQCRQLVFHFGQAPKSPLAAARKPHPQRRLFSWHLLGIVWLAESIFIPHDARMKSLEITFQVASSRTSL